MAKGVRAAATAAVLGVMFLAAAPAAAAGPVHADACRILVHDGVPMDSLTRSVVEGIFLGDIRFVGQVRVVPFTYGEGSAAERDFVTQCLGITAPAFRINWVRRVFREGIAPPRNASTTATMLGAVDSTPGAVGYLAPDSAETPHLPPRVRLLHY